MSEILGLIPARGGSRSIPRKNVASLAGKPLIVWTIEAAQASSSLSRVVVSTDDPEIAEVAQRSGAEAPFVRPRELARDETPALEVVLHCIDWLDKREDYRPEYVMVLQPTSPLRAVEDIQAAIKLAEERHADAVVSVSPTRVHPFWSKKVAEDGRLLTLFEQDRLYHRRQDLPAAFGLNGAIYLARRDVLVEQKTFYTDRTLAYVMPSERALDIDTPWDLYLAQLILQDRKKHEPS